MLFYDYYIITRCCLPLVICEGILSLDLTLLCFLVLKKRGCFSEFYLGQFFIHSAFIAIIADVRCFDATLILMCQYFDSFLSKHLIRSAFDEALDALFLSSQFTFFKIILQYA